MFKLIGSIAAVTVTLICLSFQHKKTPDNEGPGFSKDSLAKHIRILASDSFGGRKPFSIGEKRTVDYLQKTYKAMGLEPGNGNSFIQEVPMVKITPTPDPVMQVEAPSGTVELQNMTDYVWGTQQTAPEVSLNKDELVFAGFGIVAPEYNWNDYANINVKGKVVLVLVNDPGFHSGDPSFFKGDTMTYYGRWTYKYEEAARQGAKACLIIHNTEAASYPFNVVQNSWGSSNLFLDNKNDKQYHLAMQGWVTGDGANKLLQAAGKDSSLIAAAHHRGFKALSLNEKLTTTLHIKAEFNKSQNVIAKITGTKRPNEYIIYTAHWDHLGIGKPDERGDSIYNGAVDNASGTAALLEIARVSKI